MQWKTITAENYCQKLDKMPIDCNLWHDFYHKYEFSQKTINSAFECAYKVRDFTRGRRVLELFAGEGLVGMILLKHHWATYVYQTDAEITYRGEDQNIEYLVDVMAHDFGVEKRWCFLHGNVMATKHLMLLEACKFDIVIALCACGSLTDFAINFAMCQHANVIFLPCCQQKNVKKDRHYHAVFGQIPVTRINSMRIEQLVSHGYNVRVRFLSGVIRSRHSKDDVSPIYIANIPHHINKRRRARVLERFAQYKKEYNNLSRDEKLEQFKSHYKDTTEIKKVIHGNFQ